MLEKLIKDLKQTREDLETTDKEWKKKVNTIDQQLVPILPLERVVNHEILLVSHNEFDLLTALLRYPAMLPRADAGCTGYVAGPVAKESRSD